MTRNTKGQFAQNKTKDTMAVLITAFIMLSIAYYAHNAQGANIDYAQTETMGIQEISEPRASTSTGRLGKSALRNCIVSGEGTGHIKSYCSDNAENLIKAIRTDWGSTSSGAIKETEKMSDPTYKVSQAGEKYPEVVTIVIEEAQNAGFNDVQLLFDMIDCESKWNPNNTNSRGNTPSWSVDEGLWQYNNWHQRFNITSECAFDARCSTKQAIKDIQNGKVGQWVCYNLVR